MRTASQIRREFIEFFEQRGHSYVPPSPVVPYDDPTLLFTNAGMNQFKDVFLGTGTRDYTRAVNSQPCIRAGGKHNDLDDVGHDTYHHTFFEMLGNWSFGDYFKRDAIRWAWELLTEVWGLDKTRLHATYFGGDPATGLEPDEEAKRLWTEVTDIDPAHVHAGSMKDNFWEMGDTGPCGPCSEIHIDLTPDKSGAKLVNAGDPRVIEIWNLVFIQFNRAADGTLSPLPARHVDTGMGFERITALLQGKSSNYDTDIFRPLFDAIRQITGAAPYAGTLPAVGSTADPQVMTDVAYRVIADHVRCLTFAIADGCLPDREGRGYVLRRILRRAVRYGWQYLNMREPFLHRLVPVVVETLGDAFPRIGEKPAEIAEVIRDEEASFGRTLDRGIALFEQAAERAVRDHHGEISGEDAFRLHDTYGFPIDLTQIMAAEKGLRVDIGEYERLMEQARERARAAGAAAGAFDVHVSATLPATDDAPKYATFELEARLVGCVVDGTLVEAGRVPAGPTVALLLDRTCFYAEQGGQVGDVGRIETPDGEAVFEVRDTQRSQEAVLHIGQLVAGALEIGQTVRARVDADLRPRTMRNHTATHLMNWALREVLGDHVQQKGSLVDPDKTRFDLSHPRPITRDELERIESLVNAKIGEDLTVFDRVEDQKQALRICGLRAVFGEKYPDRVRVVSIGVPVEDLMNDPENPRWRAYSIEFCGGTHVKHTGEIGEFVFTAEEGVAKGVRRVVAITSAAAREARRRGEALLREYEAILQSVTASDEATQRRSDEGQEGAGCRAQGAGIQGQRQGATGGDQSLRTGIDGGQSPSTGKPASVASGLRARRADASASTDHAQQLHPDQLAAHLQRLASELAGGTLTLRHRARLREIHDQLQHHLRELQKQQAASEADKARQQAAKLLENAEQVGEIALIAGRLDGASTDQLRSAADWLKQKKSPAAVLLATEAGGKAVLLAAVSRELTDRVRAGDWVKAIAPIVEGGGGGPPTMAQAGGKNPARIDEALQAGRTWLRQKLENPGRPHEARS